MNKISSEIFLDYFTHIRVNHQLGAMKLFQPLRKLMPFLVGYDVLKEFGFVAPNAFRKCICSFTSLLGCIVLVCGTVLVGCFLIFEAKTFEEICEHFYEFATALNDTFYMITMASICKHVFELNDRFEEIIEKRELILVKEMKKILYCIRQTNKR